MGNVCKKRSIKGEQETGGKLISKNSDSPYDCIKHQNDTGFFLMTEIPFYLYSRIRTCPFTIMQRVLRLVPFQELTILSLFFCKFHTRTNKMYNFY